METYETRGVESIGIKYDALLSFLSKSDGIVRLEYVQEDNGANVLKLYVDSREYTVGTIDTSYISGSPERVPQIDHAFVTTLDWNWVDSFFKDWKNMKGDGGGVYITVTDGMIYMWGREDDYKLYDHLHIDDTELHSLDYSKGFVNEKIDNDPSESERLDNFLSLDIILSLDISTDDVKLHFENYAPIKLVSEHDNGLKQSWIVTPRIPSSNEHKTIPESVITNRTVLD